MRGAAEDGRTLVLVAYNIPHRDCGPALRRRAPTPHTYRRWIGSFADSIGTPCPHRDPGAGRRTAHRGRLHPGRGADERTALLSEAVDRLKRQPKTKVYLDAGNPAWIDDPGKLVEPLKRAGVDRADGISLNVSNFQKDDAVKAFGNQLSGLLGGTHFVIDSSRSGNGPLSGSRADAWCNPAGRALGTPPTDRTGDPLLDAFLWIKRPGESDGECRGGPAAGTWWPDYALGLARRAKA